METLGISLSQNERVMATNYGNEDDEREEDDNDYDDDGNKHNH